MFKKEKEAYRLTYSEPGDFYSSKLVCVSKHICNIKFILSKLSSIGAGPKKHDAVYHNIKGNF